MKKLFSMLAFCGAVASFFSCSETNKNNPFFSNWATPFGIPDFGKISYEHFVPAYQEGFKRVMQEIEEICSNGDSPTFENTILPYTNSGLFLSNVSSVFGNICQTEMNDTLIKLQKQITPMVTKHRDNIILNSTLFEKIKAVYDKKDDSGLSDEQVRLTDKIYNSFAMNGAALSDDRKAELRKINEQLSDLSLKFGNNLLKDNGDFVLVVNSQDDLSGLPQSVISAAAKENGTWEFSLNKSSMIPFLQYADNGDLRKKLYEGYLNRCNNGGETDNNEVLEKITNLRIDRATLLGYQTHAAFTLERCMAKEADAVYELLNELWTPALKRAEVEIKDMKTIKAKEGKGDDFNSWDWWYYAEKVRADKYALDEEMLRPYFSLETTRDGAFNLANKLFGITFTPIADVPKYNEECYTYEVKDVDGSHIGVLIMDFHPRKSKRVGAWCSSFRQQRYENGERIAPIVINVCNFTPATKETPSLLNLDEVETLFHEFGHALHSLLSDVKYNGLKSVSRDFVELPSQIMENWATNPEYLAIYAKHYETGEPIPNELINKIKNSEQFNQGFATVEYLAASLLDMDYHTLSSKQAIDAIAFEQEALSKRGLMPQIAPRYRSPYFLHIFSGGYSSGYYSYIWAEVLDADAFQAFVETGDIFNKEIADSYRKNILSVGGTYDEMESYLKFRGKSPSKIPLMTKRGLI